MRRLVADIGGTNTRIGIALGREVDPDTVAVFANEDFSGLDGVLDRYLQTFPMTGLSAACLAVAGPVSPRQAELSNRDWLISADHVAAALSLPPDRVWLVNDLAALGHALPYLSDASRVRLFGGGADAPPNGQSLVVGIGTGLNVCGVISGPGRSGVTVTEAELGYADIPVGLAQALFEMSGRAAERVVTLEDCFSGQGYAALRADLGDRDIARRALARLLGLFARQLMFLYRPLSGIAFAGGVARDVLSDPAARDTFREAFEAPGLASGLAQRGPVSLITDDLAALTGAARFLSAKLDPPDGSTM